MKNTGKIVLKRILIFLVCICFIVAVLWLLQKLVMPKYMSDITEGAMIAEYYDAPKNHDLIFIGDCEVYENFSPVVLWEDYGISSYIRGSAQQLMWQSYYLMEETLKYEKPKAIVFNILSMKYDTPQNEAYNRMTLDGMKMSLSKLASIKASLTKDEHFIDYIFPILRYHSRITELSGEDFEYLFKKDKVTFDGYYMRVDVKPAKNVPKGRPLADYKFGEVCYDYLDRMRVLCEENGVELILIKAPSLYPYWYDEWEVQMEEYADKYGLTYINFLELTDEIGIDFSKDTYDAGLHLNLSGAEKLSRYFGNILKCEHGFTSRRGEENLENYYYGLKKAYLSQIERQSNNAD